MPDADLTFSLWPDDDPDLWDVCHLGGVPLPGRARVRPKASRKSDTRSAGGRNGSRVVDRGEEPASIEIQLVLYTREQYAALVAMAPSIHYREEPLSAAQRRQLAAQAAAAVDPRASVGTSVASGNIRAVNDAGANTSLDQAGNPSFLSFSSARPNAPSPTPPAAPRAAVVRRRQPVAIAHPSTDFLGVHEVYIQEIEGPTLGGTPGTLELTIRCLEVTPESRRATTSATPAAQLSRGIGDIPIAAALRPPSQGGAGP